VVELVAAAAAKDNCVHMKGADLLLNVEGELSWSAGWAAVIVACR
jgi:hypothetical protein